MKFEPRSEKCGRGVHGKRVPKAGLGKGVKAYTVSFTCGLGCMCWCHKVPVRFFQIAEALGISMNDDEKKRGE